MMERVPEPELMEEDEQARAYAEADFDEAHSRFIALFQEHFPDITEGTVLDLGCGPGDITFRFARAHPRASVHGVDGSDAMLHYGRVALAEDPKLARRVQFITGFLPGAALPQDSYDAVISNSLLHHLHDPSVMWDSVRKFAAKGAPVYVMDLMRPDSDQDVDRLVETYAGGEPEVLRRDFHASLKAAFTIPEVTEQLRKAGLAHLNVRPVSDRHLLVTGRA
jgi:ubiquinone/menaquinone biosynthesis C-methylase UbiE